MKILTRDFGELEIEKEDVVTFVQPMFGFEDKTAYTFLYDQDNSHIVWLQSLEERDLCFIIVAPEVVLDGYAPKLPREVEEKLGEGPRMYWLVMVVAQDFKDSTVNLKSPVIVNPLTRRAAQVILDENLPIRHPFASRGKGRK